MKVNVVIQKKTKNGYVAVARYRLRTLRRTFRVQGKTLAEVNQEIVREINRSSKTQPQKISITRIPKGSGMGKFILNVLAAAQCLHSGAM